MAKTKTKTKSGSGKDLLHRTTASSTKTSAKTLNARPVPDLLAEATTFLEQSQSEQAAPLVSEAIRRLEQEHTPDDDIERLLQQAADNKSTLPQALVLGANVNLALGDGDTARLQFLQATSIDSDGALISAEPWLWLSQLCEQGGKESIEHFEKALEVLRNEIDVLDDAEAMTAEHSEQVLDEKRSKLADALCGMTEVYMTDLSWEADAEERCEQLITEAVAVCPENLSAGVLQTLASVRISQERIDEARKALASSMTIWKDLPIEVEDSAKPDFAARVSLTRLLMEVEAETDALFVLEGLMKEDDQSVECSYLRGWCYVLLANKPDVSSEDKVKHEEQARTWLGNCLRLYTVQDYQDDRLQGHAQELVTELNRALGIADDEEWEDEDEDNDIVDEDLDVGPNGDEQHSDTEMT